MADAPYWNPAVETMGAAEVAAMQAGKLRRQLADLVERSPFYARKLAAAGVAVERLRDSRDLDAVPFTDKAELRERQLAVPPLGDHAAADLLEVVRVHASSGTTGRPSYVGVTRADVEAWTEIVARVFWCEGVRPADVVVHGLGLGFFVGGLPLQAAIERIGATFVPIGTGATERLVAAVRDLGGTVLTCTPSYAAYLAERLREGGADPRGLGLRRLLVGAEPGGAIPAVRDRITADFGALVLESLGNADLAPVYAATCAEQDGNHLIAPDHLLFELIEPDSGRVLAWEDGAEGELVATHLERQCMPLLRFRTRDHVVVRTAPCPCGRGGARVRCIGRTDDLLIVNGVNVWPSAVGAVVAELQPLLTGAFEVLVTAPPPQVAPPLRLRAEHGAAALHAGHDLDALKGRLERALRERLVVPAAVELVPPGTLPRAELKARRVRRLDLEGAPR